MTRYTYRDLIRKYAADVLSGAHDRDITDRRTRRLLGISLNLASNDGWAGVVYPPTDESRANVLEAWRRTMIGEWRALLTDADSSRLGVANERAAEILRNI